MTLRNKTFLLPPNDHFGDLDLQVKTPIDDGGTILLTGGTGFVGKWLLVALSELVELHRINQEIVLVTRQPEIAGAIGEQLSPRLQISQIRPERLSELRHLDITQIAHLAAYTGNQGPESSYQTVKADLGLLLDLSDLIENLRTKPEVLYTSSGAVYGRNRSANVKSREDEELIGSMPGRNSTYDSVKKASEEVLHALSSGGMCNVVIARLFAFVGPLLPIDGHFAIGNFIQDASLGRDIVVKGSGVDFRSWMYAADMAMCLVHLWSQASENPLTVNVGSSEAMTIMDAARIVASIGGVSVDHQWVNEVTPLATSYVPDVSLLNSLMSSPSPTSLEEGVRRHLHWIARAR